MTKRITSTDIARLAKVSRSTVSRALNPDTCWRISPGKCEEIRGLCRKYGVMPSRAAQKNRPKQTRRIAFVMGAMERDLSNPGAGAMIRRMCDNIGGGVFPLKPAPDAFLHVLAKHSLRKEDAWIAGDNHTDIDAASAAGVRSIFCTWGFGTAGASVPTFRADSFSGLVGLVLSRS